MASTTFVKFYQFVTDQASKVHDLSGATGTYKMLLTNTAPALTNKVYGDVSANEIAASTGGYTTGGYTLALSLANSSGLLTNTHATLNIAPTGSATVGPFRYLILYCSSATTPNQPLIGYYDIGASTTLNAATSDTYTLTDSSGFLTQQ